MAGSRVWVAGGTDWGKEEEEVSGGAATGNGWSARWSKGRGGSERLGERSLWRLGLGVEVKLGMCRESEEEEGSVFIQGVGTGMTSSAGIGKVTIAVTEGNVTDPSKLRITHTRRSDTHGEREGGYSHFLLTTTSPPPQPHTSECACWEGDLAFGGWRLPGRVTSVMRVLSRWIAEKLE